MNHYYDQLDKATEMINEIQDEHPHFYPNESFIGRPSKEYYYSINLTGIKLKSTFPYYFSFRVINEVYQRKNIFNGKVGISFNSQIIYFTDETDYVIFSLIDFKKEIKYEMC